MVRIVWALYLMGLLMLLYRWAKSARTEPINIHRMDGRKCPMGSTVIPMPCSGITSPKSMGPSTTNQDSSMLLKYAGTALQDWNSCSWQGQLLGLLNKDLPPPPKPKKSYPKRVTAPTGHKQCTKCRVILPLEKFGRDKSSGDGLSTYCRECNRITQRAYFERKKKSK
mgnify:CR=1 FL=1